MTDRYLLIDPAVFAKGFCGNHGGKSMLDKQASTNLACFDI
jgi:hypothetical protein